MACYRHDPVTFIRTIISRDELKALLDQLPESGFDMVESMIRFLLMQHSAGTRYGVADSPDAPSGRSAWSGESNGLCADATIDVNCEAF